MALGGADGGAGGGNTWHCEKTAALGEAGGDLTAFEASRNGYGRSSSRSNTVTTTTATANTTTYNALSFLLRTTTTTTTTAYHD